jgi:hypothetical protein
LQRFDLTGRPVGNPLDLNDAVGDLLNNGDLDDANWEGLAWFDADKRVILA